MGASCLIIEVAGTVSIGGRPQVSLGGWFLFFRLRPCGVLFCAVSCICGVSERQFVPYSTVQFNLIGWPYDFPEMAAAFWFRAGETAAISRAHVAVLALCFLVHPDVPPCSARTARGLGHVRGRETQSRNAWVFWARLLRV